MNRLIAIPVVGFVTLLACFWLIAGHFGVTIDGPAALSFALLLAPYWAFGFGLDTWLETHLRGTFTRLLTPLSLIVPYLVFALPHRQFRWTLCLGMTAIVLAINSLSQHAQAAGKLKPDWHDWLVLAILGISVDLRFFDQAWPIAGLSGMPKLLFVDAGLYGFLVIRPISGIGFDFRVRWSDAGIGLREFLYFTPIAIVLGFWLRFLHLHQ